MSNPSDTKETHITCAQKIASRLLIDCAQKFTTQFQHKFGEKKLESEDDAKTLRTLILFAKDQPVNIPSGFLLIDMINLSNKYEMPQTQHELEQVLVAFTTKDTIYTMYTRLISLPTKLLILTRICEHFQNYKELSEIISLLRTITNHTHMAEFIQKFVTLQNENPQPANSPRRLAEIILTWYGAYHERKESHKKLFDEKDDTADVQAAVKTEVKRMLRNVDYSRFSFRDHVWFFENAVDFQICDHRELLQVVLRAHKTEVVAGRR